MRNWGRLCSPAIRVNFFRFLWVCFVVWGEIGAFYASLASCRWPAIKYSSEQPTHVLLVSDTQVQHPSLLLKGSRWSGSLRQFIFDLNMKKNWYIARRMKAHVLFFLGDMLANGKSAKNKNQYQDAVRKLKSIFAVDPTVSVHYIPGNNDVGMGLFSAHSNVRKYYFDAFGPTNRKIQINNHTFVAIDAPGLVDEDYLRAGGGVEFAKWQPSSDGTVAFVRSVATESRIGERQPLVLLSHIPLSRPDTASCGPMREKGTIRRGVGHGFQSLLGRETSSFLLNALQPDIVFSGDNRDYCDYKHALPWANEATPHLSRRVREITVKSFSMSVHIRKPGFQLMSLVNPSTLTESGESSFATSPCFLPDQYGIYTSFYLPLAFFTCFILFMFNLANSRRRSKLRPGPIVFTRPPSQAFAHPPSAAWSPIWTPRTPGLSVHTDSAMNINTTSSPRPKLFRLPSTSTLPPSPLLSPRLEFDHLNEDEDHTSPYAPQYAVQRTSSWKDEEWSVVESGDHHDSSEHEDTQNIELEKEALHSSNAGPPGPNYDTPTRARSSNLSWAFVFRGRVRRVTLQPPSWESCLEFGPFLSLCMPNGSSRIRRGVVKDTFADIITVFWPALFVGGIITWIMF